MDQAIDAQIVEGLVVRRAEDGEPLVRDLELAERAGLAVPRDIRRTIEDAIKDGDIAFSSEFQEVGGAHDLNPARIYAIESSVPMPNGRGHRKVTEYWLTEEAAYLVVARLRTAKASELRRAIVRVFMMLRRGELPSAPTLAHPVVEQLLTETSNAAPISKDPVAKSELQWQAKRVARARGYSIPKIYGFIRKTQNVNSPFAISSRCKAQVMRLLEHIEKGFISIGSTRLLAASSSRQQSLFHVN